MSFDHFRRKLQAKLAEAEQNAEAANQRANQLEKAKNRLQGELEDISIEAERVSILWIMLIPNYNKLPYLWLKLVTISSNNARQRYYHSR